MPVVLDNEVSLEFFDRVREFAKPRPTAKQLVELLGLINDVNLFVALKEKEIGGVMKDSNFAQCFGAIATCGACSGVALMDDGTLALVMNKRIEVIQEETAPLLIPCPGREEAKAYVQKIIERRNKRGDEGSEPETQAPEVASA